MPFLALPGRVASLLTAVAATMALVGVSAPAAEASTVRTVTGQDVGWPMCPSARGGRDKPMPPDTAIGFVMPELNAGLAFVTNQCLGDHYAWARQRSSRLGGYLFPNFPDTQMLADASTGRFGACATLACRLLNSGYAQARWDVEQLAGTGVTLPMIWVDIEHQPRMGGTREWSSHVYDNRLVLTGVFSYLAEHHIRIGVYSYASGYREIVGTWALGYPEWIPTGSSVDADRLARCAKPGFSVGPVWMTQTTRAIKTYDIDDDTVCPVAMPALPLLFASAMTGAPTVSAVRDQRLTRYAGHVLTLGAKGPAVAAAQRALRLRTTGVYDVAMAGAVLRVQRLQGWRGSGILGPGTWLALGA